MKNGRIKPLIAGLLIYLLIGLIYGWSIFVAPWKRSLAGAGPKPRRYLPYPDIFLPGRDCQRNHH